MPHKHRLSLRVVTAQGGPCQRADLKHKRVRRGQRFPVGSLQLGPARLSGPEPARHGFPAPTVLSSVGGATLETRLFSGNRI